MKVLKKKILDLDSLKKIIRGFKEEEKIIVHCHGCFDLVHYGHIKHFKEAREQGDILIVTVTEDRYVNKGKGRPFFTEDQRCEFLEQLEIIDYLALNNAASSAAIIRFLAPDIYVKGIEYKNMQEDPKLIEEMSAIESVKGKIYYTDDIVFSSTHLIENGLKELTVAI